MVNEVKLDNIHTYYMPENLGQKKQSAISSQQPEDVAVSNHLNELIKSVNSYQDPVNSAMLNDIKYQVQHHLYQVDFDKLSDKLLDSGIITMMGD